MSLLPRWVWASMAALSIGGAFAQSAAPAASAAKMSSGEDRFIAGSTLRIVERSPGDLIAAAGRLEITGPVDGDAVLAGGEVRAQGAVARNLYVAGGRVSIDGALGRHLRAAGGQVEIGPRAQVAGNASLAGGDVSVRGPVKGALAIMGGRVLIDAAVEGDVDASAGQIELGPNARIGGALRWRSEGELQRHADAKVAGPVERRAWPMRSSGPGADAAKQGGDPRSRGIAGALWTLGLMLVVAVAIAAAPAASARVAQTWRERTGASLLAGFILLVCVPVAVLLLLITVIGAPLALLALLLYFVLLPLGYVASAVALGQWALVRWKADAAGRTAWRIGAALLGVLLLALLGRVPWLGWLVGLLALLAGLGAIALQLAPRRAAATPA